MLSLIVPQPMDARNKTGGFARGVKGFQNCDMDQMRWKVLKILFIYSLCKICRGATVSGVRWDPRFQPLDVDLTGMACGPKAAFAT